MIDRMNAPSLLRLSVVGHTNVGKTSLMRTLMRDARFGEVAPTSATTRQIQGAKLLADGRAEVELFDTPGLEDAGALIERLDALPSDRHEGPERIRAFLRSDAAGGRFEQEARVLGRCLESDAMLYVIDVREPILGKYQDELAILALTARPILPVLNFVADPDARSDDWRAALARVGLHAVVEFDTVVFSLESEARLWRRLATLAESHAGALERLIENRKTQAAWQAATARAMLADLLIDAAAARRTARRGDTEDLEHAQRSLVEAIGKREQRLVDELLELFRFSQADHQGLRLPFDGTGWRHSAFDAATLVVIAPGTGSGAAAGAATGAAFDVASGGLSLGAGTLIGALTGGGAGAAWQLRRKLVDRLRGRIAVQVDDAALAVLAARALALIEALGQRGHAAQSPIRLEGPIEPPWSDGSRLPGPLKRARFAPEVSTLNRGGEADAEQRHALASRLREALP